jgi:hypothetical protein
MKKYSIVLSLLVAVTLITSCKKDDKTELDFDITLPEGWTGIVLNDIDRVYDAYRVPVNEWDTLNEGLVVYKNSVPGYTLPLYYATLKQQIQQSESYDSLTYATDTVIDASDFKKMVSHEFMPYYTSTDTTYLGMVTERYFFYTNDYGYNFTFVTVDTMYHRVKPEFDAIISSFHYKK